MKGKENNSRLSVSVIEDLKMAWQRNKHIVWQWLACWKANPTARGTFWQKRTRVDIVEHIILGKLRPRIPVSSTWFRKTSTLLSSLKYHILISYCTLHHVGWHCFCLGLTTAVLSKNTLKCVFVGTDILQEVFSRPLFCIIFPYQYLA